MKKILIVDDMSGWRDFNTNVMYSIYDKNINIDEAASATEAYAKILENNSRPYDIVITDLQMESDYAPKHAGEWLVEQIKTLPSYYRTKIVMISASYNIKQIAESLGVFCIPKSKAIKNVSAYADVLK